MTRKKWIALMLGLALSCTSAAAMAACGDTSESSPASSSSESSSEAPETVEYNVKFDSRGGSGVETQTVEKGKKATKPADPTREGYTFVEWQLNGNKYTFENAVMSDITLTAKWEKNGPQKFTVTFVAESATFSTVEVVEGNQVIAPIEVPEREGYVFDGWLLDGESYDFATPVTGALTLTAKWVNLYVVTFDVGEGTAVSPVTVKDGGVVVAPNEVPVREGYIFDGWTLNGEAYDFATPVTGDFTLTAKWANAYTVTFDVGEGTPVDPITVKDGEVVTAPVTTKTAHKVTGWLCNGESYDFTTPITSNIVLTAVWGKTPFTTDQIGVRINGWNMTSSADYMTKSVGANGEMVIGTKFQANATYSPALVLQNLQEKAYYQSLMEEGYTTFTFNLAVEGDTTDLYVFGKKVTTFAKNTAGEYVISIDMNVLVSYYDTMSTIATSPNQVGQASSITAKFITWKSPENEWSATRNYTFTISNVEYRKDALVSNNIGARINGWNMSTNADYMTMNVGENGEMIIGAKFQANATYSPALVLQNLKEKAYYEGLKADGYTALTFNLKVEGDVTDLYVFGKKVTTFAKNTDGAYVISIDTNVLVSYYDTMSTIATSPNQVGQASSINAKFITWKSPADDYASVRNYTFTISNVEYRKGALVSNNIGSRINGWNMSTNSDYMTINVGENGEMVIGAKFQANATYSPALVLQNLQEKAYYEGLIADGYTVLTFNLKVEGDVTDLYVFGKKVTTFAKNTDGAYVISIDTNVLVSYYDTMSTIATSPNQVGQASSINAKFITWKSPADDYSSVRNYVFTISNATFSNV